MTTLAVPMKDRADTGELDVVLILTAIIAPALWYLLVVPALNLYIFEPLLPVRL